MRNYVNEFGNFLAARMGPYIIVYLGDPADIEVCKVFKLNLFESVSSKNAQFIFKFSPDCFDIAKIHHKIRRLRLSNAMAWNWSAHFNR